MGIKKVAEVGIHSGINSNVVRASIELQKIYREANKFLFQNKLPMVEITIQSKGRSDTLGWFTLDKIWTNLDKKDARHEINLVAEHLNRSLEEIVGTVIHEMVHYQNLIDKVKDCSGNQYHNKKFKAAAEEVYLKVEKGKRGFAYTSLSDKLKDWVKKMKFDETAFSYFRMMIRKAAPAKTKMKKWECNCTIIRCAVDLKAKCLTCDAPFIKEEEEEEN